MGNTQNNGAINPSAIQRKLSRSGSTVPESEATSGIHTIDKIAKMLSQSCSSEDSVQGITCRVFIKELFKKFPDLGLRLFGYLHVAGASTTVDRISQHVFKVHAEKLLTIIDDAALIHVYVKMFAACNLEIERENFRDLLLTGYRIAMEQYEDGPQTCLHLHATIDAVVIGMYHQKTSVTVGFAAHWLEKNCPRLVPAIHKYVVHVLTTAHRTLHRSGDRESGWQDGRRGSAVDQQTASMELSTPVLESGWGGSGGMSAHLPLSQVWLLSTSLPRLYSSVQSAHPQAPPTSHDILMRMMGSPCPSHWVPLYNSCVDGCGSNRFITHVTNYRGPTIVILVGGDHKFLIAAPSEWKESHLYWGSADSAIMQLNPEYHVIENGCKLIYLNYSIRGYPMGLRAGSDPRKPVLALDPDFMHFQFQAIPYALDCVEVWGCGPPEQREKQVAVKKWQVKEAERQRVVKINAEDWVDHPDRYLLELNGRAVYNSKSS